MLENIENNTLEENKTTPMMAQWHACKNAAKDAVLFFRMGDFYEAFYDDAILLARELDITLTKRQDIPMSGVPIHTCDTYIDKLVARGFRVAIAEQMEDAKQAKGLVKREVVRVVTPGTVINSNLLSDKSNNFIASLTKTGSIFGFACLDLTTGEFWVSEFENERDLLNEIDRLNPAEIISSSKFKEKFHEFFVEIRQNYTFLHTSLEEWQFDLKTTHDFLTQHFKVHNLDGFGLAGMSAAINAAGALLHYIQDTLCHSIDHIQEIKPYSTAHYMALDRTTQRNLELTASLQDGTRRNTLLEVIDHTCTPMGARQIRNWIKQPLLAIHEIHKRQKGVTGLLENYLLMDDLKGHLVQVRDLERLMMKISAGYATPRDLLALKESFKSIPTIKNLLCELSAPIIIEENAKLDPLPNMIELIAQAIVDEPPLRIGEGKIFRDGYNKELDELREISRDSKAWIANYQMRLKEETGIKTLKVGYTKMFGYYIEVSKGQADKMPDSFSRRQTLVNAERYITPELKNYETKVITAEERIASIESELFVALRVEIAKYSKIVFRIAKAIAIIDCLLSLAEAAKCYHYICPQVDESFEIVIDEGRHPVIETSCLQEKFIPNDTHLDEKSRLWLITGPNMAGKSTFLRQVALIVLMAQIGSYVPAKRAKIGLVDKIFTRIGASDDLSRGQSTFMVEMSETANILNNTTSRSLIILDEIGRGTSTYDGISIAWSVAEYLLTTENKKAKTLFATHYWELTKLEEKIPGAVNYNVAVSEGEDHITFLRKIVKGGTDRSYGIHVGRLAGLPPTVIGRAKEILQHLEENSNRKNAFEPNVKAKRASTKIKVPQASIQLSLFE